VAALAILLQDGQDVLVEGYTVSRGRKSSRRHHQEHDKKSHGETPLARHYIAMEFLDARKIERPHPSLLKYYALISVLTGPGFLVEFPRLFFKYETLKYRFEDDGMSMSWGVLFRHEINLTYRRIQDIHLSRNIIQRWFGLATLSVQTASGSASPEMKIEGILEPEKLRDYLYAKMRGAREVNESPQDEALILLREIRDLFRQKSES
jgi:putative membrane protein